MAQPSYCKLDILLVYAGPFLLYPLAFIEGGGDQGLRGAVQLLVPRRQDQQFMINDWAVEHRTAGALLRDRTCKRVMLEVLHIRLSSMFR